MQWTNGCELQGTQCSVRKIQGTRVGDISVPMQSVFGTRTRKQWRDSANCLHKVQSWVPHLWQGRCEREEHGPVIQILESRERRIANWRNQMELHKVLGFSWRQSLPEIFSQNVSSSVRERHSSSAGTGFFLNHHRKFQERVYLFIKRFYIWSVS